MHNTTTSGSHLPTLKVSAIALHLCCIAFRIARGFRLRANARRSKRDFKRQRFYSGTSPSKFVIGWALLFVGLACAPLSRAERHTLGELLGGAAVTAGDLTISDWQLDQPRPPKTGTSPQDINAITVDVTTAGVSTVVLRFDTADKLKVMGEEEIDFVLRYAVTAHSGYLALGQLKLLNANIVPGAFPGSLPKLLIEEVVSEAGTPEQLAKLIAGRVTPADAQVIEPYEAVEVATRITLYGQQSDTDPTQHDLVELKAFEQSFWRAQGTFTVNSVLDLHDGNMGDGIADTGLPNNPSGITTLRAALDEADSDIQLDVIRFNIPGDAVPIIKPNAAFGALGAFHPVIIDGTTQSAGHVRLDGLGVGSDPNGIPLVGLEFTGERSSVLGMVITGFPSHGIQIRRSGSTGGGNIVTANAIGTDATGFQNLPNVGDGIHVVDMPDNQIGGGNSANVIRNNGGYGVSLSGSLATGNQVLDNLIGGLEDTGNSEGGVLVVSGAGGRDDGGILTPTLIFGNTIESNIGPGVRIDPSAGSGNTISENTIDQNIGLGIDIGLAGPTLDHVPDFDTASVIDNNTTRITGTLLNARFNEAYKIEFFASPTGDASFFGEGNSFIDSRDVTTGPTGTASFSFAISNPFRNRVITATATDSAGNTSEFSRWIRPAENTNLPPNANAGTDATVNVGTVVLLNGRGSTDPDNGPNPLTYSWVQSGGPQVTLNGANTATPNFTPNMAGTYTFTLTVSDGQASAEDQVVIVVVPGDQGQEQAIRNLISEVQALNIPNGWKNNLLARLNGALTALNRARVHTAINHLESFIDRVQKLDQRMMLSKVEARSLIDEAKDIIKALDRKRDRDDDIDNDDTREDR
jgi:hypothetical protein